MAGLWKSRSALPPKLPEGEEFMPAPCRVIGVVPSRSMLRDLPMRVSMLLRRQRMLRDRCHERLQQQQQRQLPTRDFASSVEIPRANPSVESRVTPHVPGHTAAIAVASVVSSRSSRRIASSFATVLNRGGTGRTVASFSQLSPSPPRRNWHGHSRQHSVPTKKELPTILTAEGMVKLSSRAENEGLPLVGLDVAPSNFGVAISDETRTFAIPVTRVPRKDGNKKLDPSIVLGKLPKIIEDSSACGLVVGWPLTKSGQAESQCLMVLHFLRQLHQKGKVGIPVTLYDERMTSVEARDILKEGGARSKMASKEDETAAMVILQGFLNSPEAEVGGLSTLPTQPE